MLPSGRRLGDSLCRWQTVASGRGPVRADRRTPGPKTSVVVEQGQFQVDAEQGPVVGSHRIEIQSTDNGGYAMDDEDAIRRLRESGVKRIEAVRIPPQYNTRSTLKETVAAGGPNDFRFEVKLGRRR